MRQYYYSNLAVPSKHYDEDVLNEITSYLAGILMKVFLIPIYQLLMYLKSIHFILNQNMYLNFIRSFSGQVLLKMNLIGDIMKNWIIF